MTGATLLGACITAAVQSALLVAFVAVVLTLARGADASTRHRVWFFTLVALIALPIIDLTLVALPSSGPLAPAQSAAAHGVGAFAVHHSAITLALGLWLALTAAMIARLLVSFVRLETLRRATRPVSLELAASVAAWAAHLGIRRPVEVRTSRALGSPIAIGLRDPLIVIPQRLLETLGDADIEYILVHELAHLRRRDDVTNLFAKIARALFVFNPALFVVERRMALEREIACDDWVVATLGRAHRYARCLAHVLLLSPAHAPAHGYLRFFRSPEQSVQRIEILLDAPQRSRASTSVLAIASSIFVLLLGLGWATANPTLVRFELLDAARIIGERPTALFASLRAQAITVSYATPAPTADPTFVARLHAPIGAVAYRSDKLAAADAPAPMRARDVAVVVAAARAIEAQPDRAAMLAADVASSANVASPVHIAPTHVPLAPAVSVGAPITPARTRSVAFTYRYNDAVLTPTSAAAGSASTTTPGSASTGASGSGSSGGGIGNVTLGGGGLGAPGSVTHTRTGGPIGRSGN